MQPTPLRLLSLTALIAFAGPAPAQESADRFTPRDVFALEWASDPQFAAGGETIFYTRNGFDIMTDRQTGHIWRIGLDGSGHRPVLTDRPSYGSATLSPDGTRIAFIAREDGTRHLFVHWLDAGRTAPIATLEHPASALAWSPDGSRLALTMRVPADDKPLAKMPPKPEGAEWAPPVKVIEEMTYRVNGAGYLDPGFEQIFVLPAEGGTPRQLTSGEANHSGPLDWSPDGTAIVFSANLQENWRFDPQESEVHVIDAESGEITTLTGRNGPDSSPKFSPDGRRIAYTGFDDQKHGYHVTRLYMMDRDGGSKRGLTGGLDRSVRAVHWGPGGENIFFLYDDEGATKLARVSPRGEIETVASGIGGTSLGRPYASGDYAVADTGALAALITSAQRPADLARAGGGETRPLTALNDDLLGHKTLGEIEEIRVPSSHDGREVQAWIVTPPGFDPSERYPVILEIHGGPFANYGPRFSAEVQLYAQAGYVVVYANPRGSTSYGKEFGNLIHHDYPGEDYDDLMSVMEAVAARNYIDEDRLYVTGGSGGGVLTAWIVGKTDRFRAAVVAKPVINWTSFVLTADFSPMFTDYWFPAPPWEAPDHYWARSPLSLVGNVSTPTMLLTGEEDWRTPISETEQYYQALKLRKVDTAMVRVPGAHHGIAAKPSQLIAKVVNILAWFERYDGEADGS